MAKDKITLRDWLGLKQELDFSQFRWLGAMLGAILALCAFGALLAALGALVQFVFAAFTPNSHEALRNIGFILAAAFGGPFVAWRSYTAHRHAQTAEQSYITDQINTAVQGLGTERTVKRDGEEETAPNLEVRIGAIYLLGRIAEDSLRDHISIMEILSAYIRENSPVASSKRFPLGRWPMYSRPETDLQKSEKFPWKQVRFHGHGNFRSWSFTLHPRNDIQAAMRVIGQRNESQRSIERNAKTYGKLGFRIDLRGCNLQGIDGSELDFSRVLFNGSNLEGARFNSAIFNEAIFHDCELSATNFAKCEMRNCEFERLVVEAVNFGGADLRDTVFVGCKMVDANFNRATLASTTIHRKTEFENCFMGANLRDCRFENGSVRDSTLVGAGVRYLDSGFEWSSEHLDTMAEYLEFTFGDAATVLKEGHCPPRHWPKHVLSDYDFDTEWREWLADPDNYTPPEPPQE